jgi:hypothetical protein
MRSLSLLFACSLVLGLEAKSIYEVCQSTRGKTLDPIAGCPIGELEIMRKRFSRTERGVGTKYVSQNDTRAGFKSIQEAVLAL